MTDRAPAPADDASIASAPPYIVNNVWDDQEWRAVASKRNKTTLTETEKYLLVGGPRPHPWGAAAYQGTLHDGTPATFPNKAAFDVYTEEHAADEAKGHDTLAALNEGLAAHTTES